MDFDTEWKVVETVGAGGCARVACLVADGMPEDEAVARVLNAAERSTWWFRLKRVFGLA